MGAMGVRGAGIQAYGGEVAVLELPAPRPWRDDGGRPQAQIAGVRMPMVDNGAPVGRAWLVVRQEDLLLRQSANGVPPGGLSGVVRHVGFRGTGFAYQIEVAGMPQLLKAEVATTLGSPLAVGSRVSVDWDARAALVLPRDA
jgi:TOBE domain